MSTLQRSEDIKTMADLLTRLGGVPLDRILFHPAPGTAVEQDVIDLHDRENRLAELVEGVLVEKPMGYMESLIAALLIRVIGEHVEKGKLGLVAAPDGMMRIATGLVRMPDVSVVLWERLPDRKVPMEPIPTLAPDLAVEVLSRSNTPAEIDRKLREYFGAGSKCAWVIDPEKRTVRNYSSPGDFAILRGSDSVTAENVLPGFSISVEEIFVRSGIE